MTDRNPEGRMPAGKADTRVSRREHDAVLARMAALDARLAKLNTQVNPQATQRYRIQGIPSFILFGKGREMARASGARPASDLVAFVRAHLPAMA